MILEGVIGPCGPIVKVTVRASGGSHTGEGILDTGARLSMIDRSVADRLSAPIVGSKMVKGVCDSCEMNQYSVELTVGTAMFASHLFGMGSNLYVVLLGQDFLSRGVLTCGGPNKRFRFETP